MTLREKRAGFALISVLALVSVLVIMLGGLMGTNRTAFGMLKVTQSKDRIDRTITSVYSYCRFRLEQDHLWGKNAFSGSTTTWGHLSLTEVRGQGEVKLLTGHDTINDTRFSVRLCNNLRDDGEVAIIKDVQDGRLARAGVPSGFCRLEISVEGSGHFEGAEIMVRNPGLIGGSALAHRDLSIEAASLDLMTKDPIKNQARSNSNTELRGPANFWEGSPFRGTVPDNVSTDNPVLWAEGKNTLSRGGETPLEISDFLARNPGLRGAFKEERFVDGARALIDVPDVRLDDLLDITATWFNGEGEAVAKNIKKDVKKITPGVYRFEQYGFPPVRVLTRRSAGQSLTDAVGPVQEFWWTKEDGDTRSEDTVRALVGVGSGVTAHQQTSQDDYVTINPAGGGGAQVNLMGRRMVFDNEFNFEVPGDFSLIGYSTEGEVDQHNVNPGIYFGDPVQIQERAGDVMTGDGVKVGAATNAAVTGTNVEAGYRELKSQGSLRAKGRVHLQGDISGSTTIAAKGDVSIAPTRLFDVSGNADVNFSIFSEGDVRLVPPPLKEDGRADDRDVNDAGYVTDNGHIINVSENTIKNTGLIYARGSVDLDMRDTATDSAPRSFIAEGAIVALRGSLTIKNADKVEFIYNPQFVDRVIKPELSTGLRRIEITGWRATKPSSLARL